MITVYILRAFGGVLAVQMPAPIPPVEPSPNVTFYLRSGAIALFVRSGEATMEVRGA